MKSYIYKSISFFISVVLVITLLCTGGSYAESVPLKLSKEEAKNLVVTYSPILKQLEKSKTDLVMNYSSLNKSLSGLKTLYDYLPRYKVLYNLYQQMRLIDKYDQYLALAIQGNIAVTTQFLANNGDVAVAVADPSNMTVEQYGEYLVLAQQFALISISNPNLSPAQEYETFISPLHASTMSMQTGIMNLGITSDATKESLRFGIDTLYDTLLMLQGYQELQSMNYAMAKNNFDSAEKKYKAGLLSKTAYDKEYNKQAIAYLNMDTMNREVENLTMQLNLMLGLNITTELELTTQKVIEPTLGSLNEYVQRGLSERSEMLINKNNYQNSVFQFGLIKGYYSSSSLNYKISEAEVSDFELEKEQLMQQITLEINKAYLNAIDKEHAMVLKKAVLEDANRQLENLKKNIKLGLVTDSTRIGLELMVTQATNDYNTARRDYQTAYNALQNASSIGPKYQNQEVQ